MYNVVFINICWHWTEGDC